MIGRPRLPRHPRTIGPAASILLIAVAVTACGGSAASGSPVASVPASAAGPSGSASASPTTSSSAAPAGDALGAFRDFVQSAESFHIDGDIGMQFAAASVGNMSMRMEMGLDVSGADQHGTIDIIGAGQHIQTEVVLVDDVAYARVGDGAWQVVPVESTSSNPLAELDLESLVDVGASSVNGTPVRHLQVSDPRLIDTSAVVGSTVSDLRLDEATYDIYVTAEGIPVTMTLTFGGEATLNEERVQIEADVRYDFSGFGEPVVISAPPIPASASPA